VVGGHPAGRGGVPPPGRGLRRRAPPTGLSETALEASAVADPYITVKADVERLLTSPLLAPQVSVSGHVYDTATGRVATILDARYP
jgi:carbonic anhydrase